MSEENKLTYEATIDSLKEMAIKFSKDIYVNRVLANAINLIQELQDENKSFGETINQASETLRNQRAKIEQLKINLTNEKKWGKIQAKKTEKETAREILQSVGDIVDDGDDRFKYKDYQWHKRLCKRYGVEVDYEN